MTFETTYDAKTGLFDTHRVDAPNATMRLMGKIPGDTAWTDLKPADASTLADTLAYYKGHGFAIRAFPAISRPDGYIDGGCIYNRVSKRVESLYCVVAQ